MITVVFPEPHFKIRKKGEKQYIFDTVRKQWLLLTEEEWVRQNLVAYLTEVLLYPRETIALEKEILVNGLTNRFDILVYDAAWKPWMIIECKASAVPLSEAVLQQALRYHLAVPVNYIILSNGTTTIGWEKRGNGLQLLESFPAWP